MDGAFFFFGFDALGPLTFPVSTSAAGVFFVLSRFGSGFFLAPSTVPVSMSLDCPVVGTFVPVLVLSFFFLVPFF